MHRLIGHVPITFGSLTGTEVREHGLREVQLQHVLDGELPVLHHQRTTERIRVLDAVTSEMKNVSRSPVQGRVKLRQ
jgi:hypothetical protein